MKAARMMDAVVIANTGPTRLDRILEFVRSWSEDDAYERFGILGGRQWLLTELRCNDERRAIVATVGERIVGLLDHIETENGVHIGVVVDAQFRGLHVATEMVRELLHKRRPESPVAAECRAHNRAAIGLLKRCGFERVRSEGDELVWRHR